MITRQANILVCSIQGCANILPASQASCKSSRDFEVVDLSWGESLHGSNSRKVQEVPVILCAHNERAYLDARLRVRIRQLNNVSLIMD
jgi:hypothetical protein